MYTRSELSECELVTMKCIWDAGRPVTCHEIRDRLSTVYGLVYKDTTVYTFLKYLKQKGFVDSYKKGITYYQPIRDEVEYREGQLRKLEDFWFQGSSVGLLASLFEMKEMSKEEQEAIKNLVEKVMSK